MSLALVGGLGAILEVFFAEYIPQGHSPTQIVWLLTFPSLFVGFGNFLILPMSLAFGRRPTFIVCVICLLAATIGSATQNSFEAHLATRIIQGLATGATESVSLRVDFYKSLPHLDLVLTLIQLLPLMLTDISFLHERSKIFGWYWATQNIFSSALSLASSYEATISWRWFYWVYVIAISIGLVLVIFGAFETRFARAATAIDGQVIVTDDFGVTHVLTDQEARTYAQEIEQRDHSAPSEDMPARKTYIQKLKPWNTPAKRPGIVILKAYWHMLESFSSPGIVYAILLSSITLGSVIALSLTYNAVLQNNYHWAPQNIGLINIGGMIGGFLGMLYAGYPADKFAIWMARRNNGIHKPEHRLLPLIPAGILGFASLLLYGFTANGKQTWWGPYIGWTVLQIVFTVVLIVSTAFAAEAWPKNPGPAITVVVGSKNIVSFAASYGITPMINEHGYTWACGVLAAILGAIYLLIIPVYYINPIWRRKVAGR